MSWKAPVVVPRARRWMGCLPAPLLYLRGSPKCSAFTFGAGPEPDFPESALPVAVLVPERFVGRNCSYGVASWLDVDSPAGVRVAVDAVVRPDATSSPSSRVKTESGLCVRTFRGCDGGRRPRFDAVRRC